MIKIEYDIQTTEMKQRLESFWTEFLILADKYQIDGYIEAGSIPDYDNYESEE